MDQLAASAAAINELCSSLEDESLSTVTVSGLAASFTVQADDGTAYSFVATFTGASLPCPASLACTRGSVRGLAKANGKLGAKSSLAKAVAAAGRCVAVDLDWVAEAEEAGECSAPPPASRLPRPPRGMPRAATYSHAHATTTAACCGGLRKGLLAQTGQLALLGAAHAPSTACRRGQRRRDGGCLS